jgi:hypothetical protein
LKSSTVTAAAWKHSTRSKALGTSNCRGGEMESAACRTQLRCRRRPSSPTLSVRYRALADQFHVYFFHSAVYLSMHRMMTLVYLYTYVSLVALIGAAAASA